MRVLIYGSSYVTALVERELSKTHEIVGHVPCASPAFPGQMLSPETRDDSDYDLALSVMYDRKVKRLDRAYNLHPGLLPRWGGCNILYHTIAEGANEQGMTFHQMTADWDRGGIVLRSSYPVFPHDRIVDLFERNCLIAPQLAVAGIALTAQTNHRAGPSRKPVYYPRSLVLKRPDIFAEGGRDIRQYVASHPL